MRRLESCACQWGEGTWELTLPPSFPTVAQDGLPLEHPGKSHAVVVPALCNPADVLDTWVFAAWVVTCKRGWRSWTMSVNVACSLRTMILL